tara:strand:+ start:2069 stop:2716 length:648 start_codon:yes stop_codon:yes gene_type:complete
MGQEMLLSQISKYYYLSIIIFLFSLSTAVKSKTIFDYFNYIENLQSFSASFSQYTYNENDSLIKKSNGNIIYKKKSKYILEYLKPNKIKFISDGQFLTTYDEDLEQVIIQSLGNNQNKNIVELITNKNLIDKNFNMKSYTINGENHIKFTPKLKDSKRNILLLVIKNNEILKISFMNDFEQSVTMNFSNFKKNQKFLDSLFRVDYPENFDVIIDK